MSKKIPGLEMTEDQLRQKVLSVDLSKKFIYSKDIQRALTTAILMGKNLLLYGRGGHAKSEMVKEFLKQADLPNYTMTLSQGTTFEKFFGGIDLKALMDDGEEIYSYEKSFATHPIVVFEEGFDAPEFILEAMKDLMTEKRIRTGEDGKAFPVTTRTFIVCTNRSKEEMATDDSLEALMQRFVIEKKVEWKSYTSKDYQNLIEKVFGLVPTPFCDCVALRSKDKFISPRTAVAAFEILQGQGVEALRDVAGFDDSIVSAMKKQVEKVKQRVIQKKLLETYKERLRVIKTTICKTKSDYLALIKKIDTLIEDFSSQSWEDSLHSPAVSLFNSIKQIKSSSVERSMKSPGKLSARQKRKTLHSK